MNLKSFLILLFVLIAGVGAYWFSSGSSKINSAARIGSPIMPNLQSVLNQIDKIELLGSGNRVITSLNRSEKQWTVMQRENYPADIGKIRNAMVSLAQATIVEEKTSNKDLYVKLGVEDVSEVEASGIQVNVFYNDQSQSLIVGKPGPQINKNRFVRHANESTSWLVDRKLDLNRDVAYWLQKDLFSLEPEEIASVSIELADGATLVIKNTDPEGNTFVVANLTDPNSRVIDAELHQITNALSSFQMLDVSTVEQFADVESTMTVTYTLKNQIELQLTAYELEDENFAKIDVLEITDQPSDETINSFATELRAKTSGWVYKIPNVSYDSMYKREADVLAITEDQLN